MYGYKRGDMIVKYGENSYAYKQSLLLKVNDNNYTFDGLLPCDCIHGTSGDYKIGEIWTGTPIRRIEEMLARGFLTLRINMLWRPDIWSGMYAEDH